MKQSLNSKCIQLVKFQGYEDWANVKQAYVNAAQLLRRLRNDVKEMEEARSAVCNRTLSSSLHLSVQTLFSYVFIFYRSCVCVAVFLL